MLSKDQYIQLYEKYTNGNCSKEELQKLETYKDSFEFTDTQWNNAVMGDSDEVKNRIYKKLLSGMNENSGTGYRRYIWLKWGAVAATLLIILGAVWMLQKNKETTRTTSVTTKNSIIPGGDKAMLILEDGTQVDLENTQSGAINSNGKYIAAKVGDGKLEYRDEDTKTASLVSYHTLRTPKGGQFQLRLPDGTMAWLNAASSIRYPTAFVGAERRVEISGEVYFDVKKQNGKHFIVQTNNQEITVLGTRFNVFAYTDESFVQTSLIEGKVQVDINDRQLMLKPGLSSVYHKDTGKIRTKSFDPDEVLAWQQGNFNFNAEPIESVMRKISRWYDVEIYYEGDIKGKMFSGSLSRFSNVQDILEVIALTGVVKFKIKDRKIYVIGN
ncbi:fec operon regulator FecR [Sphingobacterium spiritivorum]|uniref:Fec operon regulator FecR n=1 Tax=Sphingobacterium spiritivorum TaxID=258 RepID=A0A380BJW4_SPHSI|nr:FecR family protein [Sphingobacterium spiritivorum]SUJ02520.1 fec operon regulator FecR [Sphingobacterium spiritivorum]